MAEKTITPAFERGGGGDFKKSLSDMFQGVIQRVR